MHRSILSAVDFSEPSQLALQYAVALAERDRAALTILTVNEPLLNQVAGAQYGPDYLSKQTETELRAFLGAGQRGRGVEPRFDIRVGDPADEIASAARDARADLIVLGTHGLSGYHKLFLGSVTQKVLRHTTWPILTIPANASAPDLPVRFQRTIVALDLEGDPRHVIEKATSASGPEATHVLVHVVPKIATTMAWSDSVEAEQRAHVAKQESTLEQIAAALPTRASTTTRVMLGRPAEQIALAAEEEKASLIVMGLKREEGLLKAHPGSIAYRVLTTASVPVLVCP